MGQEGCCASGGLVALFLEKGVLIGEPFFLLCIGLVHACKAYECDSFMSVMWNRQEGR